MFNLRVVYSDRKQKKKTFASFHIYEKSAKKKTAQICKKLNKILTRDKSLKRTLYTTVIKRFQFHLRLKFYYFKNKYRMT